MHVYKLIIESYLSKDSVKCHVSDGDIPGTPLVCIDLQPYTTTQAPDRDDILNIGGFSDAVFSVVSAFLADDPGRFVAEVEAVEL